MPSSTPSASPLQPLPSLQINNQNNAGLIGDGSNNIVNSDIRIEKEDELNRLLGRHVSQDALRNSFYSPPECHPNTRTTVRNEIGEWIDESGSEKSPLLWLNGPAAIGKSVIAKTISGFHEQIVATFFFSTSSDKSAATLFPTLAWQLAGRIPDTRNHIIASLNKSGSLPTSQIEDQFDLLIIQPLKKSATTLSSRPVMVIDGVDECTDENMLRRLLRVLVQAGEGGDMPVRFIICSRPEPRIYAIMGRVRDANPNRTRQEPSMLSKSSESSVGPFATIGTLGLIVGFPLFVLNSDFPKSNDGSSESDHAQFILSISIGLVLLVSLEITESIPTVSLPYRQSSGTQIQRSQGFLQGAWELYRPIQLDVDKDAPVSATSGELTDTFDMLCPHPVISTIQIGLSQESKDDIARYLTDNFNAIYHPGEGTSPWFQPSDISGLVEASCGQFLYASTIVRLLDDPESHFDARDVFKMARCSSLPTPDLNKLYKAILKRAQDAVRNQAKEGGLDDKTEWQFVMDSLSILVFFARHDDHFLTVRKSLPIIETLLGLENGKLSLKLCKMHAVLRIDAEGTIQVHHRSFLEFLQNRERSGEYYIAYSKSLRRILILMTRAGFRNNIMHSRMQSQLGCVQDMVTECRHNFFWRSRSPIILELLHLSIHLSLMLVLSVWCSLLLSKHTTAVVQFFFTFVVTFVTFFITYILSLIIHTWSFHRSIIIPFFHPLLHPFFFFLGGFLFRSRLISFLFFAIIVAVVVLLTTYDDLTVRLSTLRHFCRAFPYHCVFR